MTNQTPISLSHFLPQNDAQLRILKERAKHLSKPIAEPLTQVETSHYVGFNLGNESYGIPYEYIKEIMLYVKPTNVPYTPDYITGVINLHGELLTIVDLQAFFQLKLAQAEHANLIIVCAKGITVAILTGYIIGSTSYEASHLEPPLAMDGAIHPKYIIGLDSGTTAILNIETLLCDLQTKISPLKESTR